MALTEASQTTEARLNAILDDVQRALVDIIHRHRVTQEEFRAATEFLAEAGRQHLEIPLMFDVFLASAVDDVAHATEGTEFNIEGPVYVAGAPVLERPYALPRRADEPGDKLIFSGTVRSTDGAPLAGATLDVWQANGAAEYSHFQPDVPEYNLRGKLMTDDDGRFEFETVVPSPYEVPTSGATGRLLAALGRSAFRPSHIHFKISHAQASPLTTQIYFEGDPWLDADVVGAVKASLVTKLTSGPSHATCSYDFVLPAPCSK
jgi:catechol 1,2-dioxygenase